MKRLADGFDILLSSIAISWEMFFFCFFLALYWFFLARFLERHKLSNKDI